MRLVYAATQRDVREGDEVVVDGMSAFVQETELPRKHGSLGRVYVTPDKEGVGMWSSCTPDAFNAVWVANREKRAPSRKVSTVSIPCFTQTRSTPSLD